MTGNSCYKITVAVNTPPVIYLRMLSGLTRILRVNRRNIPTPPVETCHSYYDTELRPVREEKGRKKKRGRERPGRSPEVAEARRSLLRRERAVPSLRRLKSYFHRDFTTCLHRRPLTNKSLFPARGGLSSRFIQIGEKRRENSGSSSGTRRRREFD